ncbi:MAG: zinc-binding dehydrogenase [Chloroflexi bacterium]|nr:zinc-binding dehydrogenase [Chloroflexota bacterium]
MRAAVFYEHGGIEKLKLEEMAKPHPAPGEALVRVRACGVNRLDLLVRSGQLGARITTPHILGSEVAGEIAELGEPVTDLSVGQRVVIAPYLYCGRCEYCLSGEESVCLRGDILGMMGNGGYAEFVRAPASNLVSIPANVSFNDAAAVTLSTLTAWHMVVTRARTTPGETVLVLAAGSGIGSSAIQIARLAGARVIATASTEDKLAKAKELGADEVIDYGRMDFLEEVKRLTNKRGVDLVVEHVGANTWEKSVGCLARNGRLVTCGATTGREAPLNIWQLFAKQITLIGSYGGTRGELQQVLNLVAQGKLRAVIHSTYPLEAIAEAHRTMEDRRQFGKLIINP